MHRQAKKGMLRSHVNVPVAGIWEPPLMGICYAIGYMLP